MAKRNVVDRALRNARNVLNKYVRPGARTAEAQIDDLLVVLGDARRALAKQRASMGRRLAKLRRGAPKRRRKAAARTSARRRAMAARKRPVRRTVRTSRKRRL